MSARGMRDASAVIVTSTAPGVSRTSMVLGGASLFGGRGSVLGTVIGIDSVAATHPDGLLISPVDSAALTPPLTQVRDAGTKVVLVDTAVTDPSVGVSRISSDNEAGRLAEPRRPSTAGPGDGSRRGPPPVAYRHDRQVP